ncbi:hypothetical protein [Loigolactobacillus binensis]|uniref:DUF3899 domain-containing protein n=1 Tax=Loigolactobacillus binensis TaxID=2559922 RepID=A0ABW3ECT7_9LACO|nr:hypothetical protein [Loigolactobacillus binensis]
MKITLLFVVGASFAVNAILCQVLLWRLVRLDAAARNIAHPHLAGLLATSGQNGSGLFMYLILRRQREVIAELDDAPKRHHLKIQLTAGFAVMLSLFISFSLILFLLN